MAGARKPKEPKGPTRAQINTAKRKASMLQALRASGCNVTKSSEAAGISYVTHYQWLKDDPEYEAAVNEAREATLDKVERWLYRKIFEAAKDSDQIRAAEIYLKARAKDRGYGVEKRDQSVSGDLNVNAKVQKVIFELPDNTTGPGDPSPVPPDWEAITGGGEPG